MVALKRFVLSGGLIAALVSGGLVAAARPATADHPPADFRVEVSPDPVAVSGVAPLTVDIQTNVFSNDAEVQLALDLSGLRDVEVLPGAGPCRRSGGNLICTWAAGGFTGVHGRQIVFPVRRTRGAPDGAAGTVRATVRSAAPDPDPANNTATAEVTISRQGVQLDASVADLPRLIPGTAAPIRWAVANRGRVAATGVTAVVSAPEDAAFFNFSGPCERSRDFRTLTCPLGDLAPGATVAVPVPIDIEMSSAARPHSRVGRGTLIVTGSPAGGAASAARDDNYDAFPLSTRERVADLFIGTLPAAGRVGQKVSVQFGTSNFGPSVAPYTFRFTVPTGTDLVAAPDFCRAVADRTYRCDRSTPAAAGGPDFAGTLDLTITSAQVGPAQLTISGPARDPKPDNNAAPIAITVTG